MLNHECFLVICVSAVRDSKGDSCGGQDSSRVSGQHRWFYSASPWLVSLRGSRGVTQRQGNKPQVRKLDTVERGLAEALEVREKSVLGRAVASLAW